jgi:hypothetical protein
MVTNQFQNLLLARRSIFRINGKHQFLGAVFASNHSRLRLIRNLKSQSKLACSRHYLKTFPKSINNLLTKAIASYSEVTGHLRGNT